MLEVVERFRWRTPKGFTVAIHCTPPEGSVRESIGFRILRNGVCLYPASLPFKTRDEAEMRMIEIACPGATD